MSKVFFVMPAYNEAENIEETIRDWYPIVEKCGASCRLVIANDGSKDNTYEIMLKIREKYPLLVPLNKPNSGHGATVLFLYHYAIEHGAEYIFQTDSDGQTCPTEFWQFYRNREKFDFLIGHRLGRGDGIGRIFVTKILRLVVWLIFRVWVKDANTPFRLMNVEKLKSVLGVVPKNYFLCNVAISAIAVKWNYKIEWYKITFKPRAGGVNSINFKRIVKIGWKAISDFQTINKNLNRHI